MQTHSAL